MKNVKLVVIVSIDTHDGAPDSELQLSSEGMASRYARKGIETVRISIGPGKVIGSIATKTKTLIPSVEFDSKTPSNLDKLIKCIYHVMRDEVFSTEFTSERSRFALITLGHGLDREGPTPYFLISIANALYEALKSKFTFAYFLVMQCYFAGDRLRVDRERPTFFEELVDWCKLMFNTNCPVLSSWDMPITVQYDHPEIRKIAYDPYASRIESVARGKLKYNPRIGAIQSIHGDDSSESDADDDITQRLPSLHAPLVEAKSHYCIYPKRQDRGHITGAPTKGHSQTITEFIVEKRSTEPQYFAPTKRHTECARDTHLSFTREGTGQAYSSFSQAFVSETSRISDFNLHLGSSENPLSSPTLSSPPRFARRNELVQAFWDPNGLQIYLTIRPDSWVRYQNANHCLRCGEVFNIIRRPHHCRSCGDSMCHKCSYMLLPVGSRVWATRTRFCVVCVQDA